MCLPLDAHGRICMCCSYLREYIGAILEAHALSEQRHATGVLPWHSLVQRECQVYRPRIIRQCVMTDLVESVTRNREHALSEEQIRKSWLGVLSAHGRRRARGRVR